MTNNEELKTKLKEPITEWCKDYIKKQISEEIRNLVTNEILCGWCNDLEYDKCYNDFKDKVLPKTKEVKENE